MDRKRTIEKDGSNENQSLEELADLLIAKCMDALEKHQLKVTVADLIRIRELQKELAPRQPVKADVTWIDGWD